MKKVIQSEWQRLWSQKVSWLCLLSIPFLLTLSAKISLAHNSEVPKHYSDFTYANNFPVISLSEHLIITLNMIVLLLVVLTFSHEYHSGQMRLILQRTFSFTQIVFAKWIAILLYLTTFLVVYFLCSYLFGFFQFEYKSSLTLMMHNNSSSHQFAFLYNLMYFLLALCTLTTMASVLITLSLLSKSTTGATALCVGFIFISFIYPYIIQLFEGSPFLWMMFYSSLVMMQYEGIAIILAGNAWLKFLLLSIILGYLLISNLITFCFLAKRDHFI